jgi:hypothetical protein
MNSREHLTAKLEHLDLLADTFEASTQPEDMTRLARVLIDSADYITPNQSFSNASDPEYVNALQQWWDEHRTTLDKARNLVL